MAFSQLPMNYNPFDESLFFPKNPLKFALSLCFVIVSEVINLVYCNA